MLIDKLLRWVENRNMPNALAVFGLDAKAGKKELERAYQALLDRYQSQNRGQLYECARTAIDAAYQYLNAHLESDHPLMVVEQENRMDWDRISKELYDLKAVLEHERRHQTYEHDLDDAQDSRPKLKSKKRLFIILAAVILCAVVLSVVLLSKTSDSSKDTFTDGDLQIGNHRYYFYPIDISWTEAQEQCRSVGGHLITFDQTGEYESVVAYIESKSYLNQLYFYIGGSRTSDGNDYTWVDTDGNQIGTSLLNGANKTLWSKGEPAFEDGETKMILGRDAANNAQYWCWFEIPDNAVSEYAGSLGYILEYD